jgi:hypothetical protein
LGTPFGLGRIYLNGIDTLVDVKMSLTNLFKYL